jgi:hypothetical protein
LTTAAKVPQDLQDLQDLQDRKVLQGLQVHQPQLLI